MDGVSKLLRTATYLLRFTPEEKAELEQKVRVAAALGKSPLTLAEALSHGSAQDVGRDDREAEVERRQGEPGRWDGHRATVTAPSYSFH